MCRVVYTFKGKKDGKVRQEDVVQWEARPFTFQIKRVFRALTQQVFSADSFLIGCKGPPLSAVTGTYSLGLDMKS